MRAERKAGSFLAEMDMHPAGRPPRNPSHEVSDLSTLAELGIEYMQSSRWQAEASVPEERFEAWGS